MPTANEEIQDAFIRRQTYLIRYAGGLRNELYPQLEATAEPLRDAVERYVSRVIDNRSLLGREGKRLTREFDRAVREIRNPVWDNILNEASSQLKELAAIEAANTGAIVAEALPVVINFTSAPAAALTAIVASQPFQGATLREWMRRTNRADVERILRLVKAGIVQGETPTEIARRVVGPRRGIRDPRKRGAIGKAFRDLESVLLTVTNGVQNDAAQAFYEQNADLFQEEIYIATLDSRTTPICASNDNKRFPRGEGPMPPLHFRCRSRRWPYMGPDIVGRRPLKASTDRMLLGEFTSQQGLASVTSRADLPRGFKTRYDQFSRRRVRELTGQVPSNTSYTDFLRRQSVQFQNEVLGIRRAQLFRSTNLHLDRFVARDGSFLTLQELAAKGIR